jgi:hypothetical protein
LIVLHDDGTRIARAIDSAEDALFFLIFYTNCAKRTLFPVL